MATSSKRGVVWAKAERTFPNGRKVRFSLPIAAPEKKQRKKRKADTKSKSKKARSVRRGSAGPITNPARLLGSGAAPAAKAKTKSSRKGKKATGGGQLTLLG